MACLSLALLGPPQVTRAGQLVTRFATDKVRALLIYLVMEADRPHHRDTLAELLWPEQPAQVARNSLRQALALLRQAIGDRTAVPPFLHIRAETIQFNTASDHWLDVAAFTDLLDACRHHSHAHPERCTACARRLQQAVALYRGNFLDQLSIRDSVAFEEWTLLQRERLRRLVTAALARLTTYFERRSAYDLAERYAWQQVELDPWREEAQRQLLRVLALSGQRSAALRQYDVCRRVLQDELGVAPAPETDALYEQIRAGTVTASVSPRRVTPPLPAAPTSFIGRVRERADLADLLTDTSVRLVTLVGAPGIGKTRLALQVATEIAADFAGGAVFVALAPISAWELVIPTIAQLFGVRATGDRSLLDTLIDVMRAQTVLLLLDNVEQVLPVGPQLATLLEGCPTLTLLVTSRAPLHLAAEHTFDVPPLTLPDTVASLATVTASEAGTLFIARATAVQRDVALTEATAGTVAAICRRLDGLPLAIELAARRCRLMTPAALLAQLEHRLALLTGGARDVAPRQQTLRATIDWSYRLLAPAAQRLFARLAVFVGGWTVEAADAVCSAADDLDSRVFDGLHALVDQQLVQVNAGADGAPRFGQFETIRDYAQELLAASGEATTVQERHARYFLNLAERAEPELRGPHQAAWLDRLDAEHDNLRAALAWCQAVDSDGAGGWRLAAALWRFWFLRGHAHEWNTWLAAGDAWLGAGSGPKRAAMALPAHAAARARLLAGLAVCVLYQGQWQRAAELARASLPLACAVGDGWTELVALVGEHNPWVEVHDRTALDGVVVRARERGDPWLIAWALSVRWFRPPDPDLAQQHARLRESVALARAVGDPWLIGWTLAALGNNVSDDHRAEAIACLEESLALRRALGDTLGMGWSLVILAGLLAGHGEYAAATPLAEERLAVERALGNTTGIVNALDFVAWLAAAQGQYRAAQQYLEESLALDRALAETDGDNPALYTLGLVALAQGDTTEATVQFSAALRVAEERGSPRRMAETLIMLGRAALAAGALAQAEAHYRACLPLCSEQLRIWAIGHVLAGLAGIASGQGEAVRAARLFGAAWRVQDALDIAWDTEFDRVDYGCQVAGVRATLDAATFDAAWTEGQALAPEQAIASALAESGGTPVPPAAERGPAERSATRTKVSSS